MTDSAETQEAKANENPHVAALNEAFGPVESSTFRGQQRVIVPAEKSFDALSFLKSRGFDLLVDVSCVDYLEYRGAKHRYGLVYLCSFHGRPATANCSSFCSMTPSQRLQASFLYGKRRTGLEREVWDLFGIHFTGHPDLRRLVMPEEFTAHPLRKDYPLQGRGERHNFPVITRDHS